MGLGRTDRSAVRWQSLALAVLVAGAVAAFTPPLPAAQATPRLVVDGRPVSAEVIVREGRVYVPLRAISEALGAGVQWDPATRTVTVTRAGAGAPPAAGEIITFVYIVNQTGAEVHVRAWADGRELFDRRLPATAAPQPGVVPPPPPYPALELKVAMPRQAGTLEVEEDMILRLRRSFGIRGFDRIGAGFRITLTHSGIDLSQDYRPIR